MEAIDTGNTNRFFAPTPKLAEESDIYNVPTQTVIEDGGKTVVYSVWEPTEEERAAIANGANIKLGIGWIGGFPPVTMEVTEKKRIKNSKFEKVTREASPNQK